MLNLHLRKQPHSCESPLKCFTINIYKSYNLPRSSHHVIHQVTRLMEGTFHGSPEKMLYLSAGLVQ